MVSTGTTSRTEAMEVCSKYAALAAAKPAAEGIVPNERSGELVEAGIQLIQAARRGELGESSARDFVNRVLKASKVDSQLEAITTRKFFTTWLEGKKLRRSTSTGIRYGTTVSMFLDYLGKRADLSIAALGAGDVEGFRNQRMKNVGQSTVADDLRIVRMVFRSALKRGHITLNPADTELVERPDFENQSRNPFTPAEINLLLDQAPGDWKLVIALGAFCGCRLGDAATMPWEAVDFENGVLRYRQKKTKRDMEIPLHPDLLALLEAAAGDEGGFIAPSLATQVVSGRSGLSRQFIDIVRGAGLDLEVVEAQKRDGKVVGRSFTKRSFHSLRVSFASILANNGVAPELRKELTGHKSDAVHGRYTKLQMETLRQAINKIPTSHKAAPKSGKPTKISRRPHDTRREKPKPKPSRKAQQ